MLVFDETVTIFIAVIPNPFQGAVGVGQQGCDRLPGKAPAAYSSQDVDEKRGSVNASVVGVFAAQGESAGNTKPHLMQDLARLFLGRRIHYAALALSQVWRVPNARDGSTGRSISEAHNESRPNRVMNQGAPAATTTLSG